MSDKQTEIMFCEYCGKPVATRLEVYAIVHKRHPFSDTQLDSPESHLKVYHKECQFYASSLATLPPEKARKLVADALAEPDDFVYTLDIPTLRDFGIKT